MKILQLFAERLYGTYDIAATRRLAKLPKKILYVGHMLVDGSYSRLKDKKYISALQTQTCDSHARTDA